MFRLIEWRLIFVIRLCLIGCGWWDMVIWVLLFVWLIWFVELVECVVYWDIGVCMVDCFLLMVNNVVYGLLDMILVDGFFRLCCDLLFVELGLDFLLLIVVFIYELDGVWEVEVFGWVLIGDDIVLVYDIGESLEFICFCKLEFILDSCLILLFVLLIYFCILV